MRLYGVATPSTLRHSDKYIGAGDHTPGKCTGTREKVSGPSLSDVTRTNIAHLFSFVNEYSLVITHKCAHMAAEGRMPCAPTACSGR